MSHILYRESLNRTLPVAVAGDGPYIIDAAGKRYIDGSGGAAVSCLGHSNEAVRKAIREQADQLAFAHSRFFTTEAAEKLADDLVNGAPGELNKVWLTCGGSEAVEQCLADKKALTIGDRCNFSSGKQRRSRADIAPRIDRGEIAGRKGESEH